MCMLKDKVQSLKVALNIFRLCSFMCDTCILFEWPHKSWVATFCCFSQFSALSTEKFNRGASSWQHEFFTIDVDRQYELNGTVAFCQENAPMSKKSNFPYFPYPKILGINLPNSNVVCSDVTYCNVIHQSH